MEHLPSQEIIMPTKSTWVRPETMLVHNTVTVYHTYENDDVDQGTNRYWFTLNPDADDEAFDIRELSPSVLDGHPPYLCADANPEFANATQEQINTWRQQWVEWITEGECQAIRQALMDAIDRGVLKNLHDGPGVPSR